MEWKKLKNIILLILVVLNVALAILIGGPALSDYYRSLQGDRGAVAFLEGRGIGLDGVTIPNPEKMLPQVVERDREEEERLARKLLGEKVVQEARGGEVYRYTSDLGVLQFHSDGSFWTQLNAGAFPTGDSAREAALAVLGELEFSGTVTTEHENAITVCQVWENARLFNQQATVLWDETGVREIAAGRRLYGAPAVDFGQKTIDQATALIDFYNELNRLGDVCSRVDEIVPGYISASSLSRRMELTPVWRITTDTGAYQLDLVTGGLERVS